MNDRQAVSVKILDREYRVACAPEERRDLIEAAEDLDRRMRELRRTHQVLNSEKLAVITALNLANEVLAFKRRQNERGEQLSLRMKDLSQQIEGEIARHDGEL